MRRGRAVRGSSLLRCSGGSSARPEKRRSGDGDPGSLIAEGPRLDAARPPVAAPIVRPVTATRSGLMRPRSVAAFRDRDAAAPSGKPRRGPVSDICITRGRLDGSRDWLSPRVAERGC